MAGWIVIIHQPEIAEEFGHLGMTPLTKHHSSDVTVRSLLVIQRYIHRIWIFMNIYIYTHSKCIYIHIHIHTYAYILYTSYTDMITYAYFHGYLWRCCAKQVLAVLEYPGKDGHNMASHSAASPSELSCPDFRTAKGQKPWWHAWSRDVEDPILCKPLTMKHVHFSCYEFMCISVLFNLLNLLQYLNFIHVLATGGFHEHTSPFSTILEANGVKEDGNRHHDHCTFLASARFEPIKTTRKH